MSPGVSADAASAVGWHGKLPTVGDFATRRLDLNFVAAWDEWLSSGLEEARASAPDQWPAAYLESPTWNFLLTPQFLPAPLDTSAWIGVLMPSVDKVGRYYPLTLACPLKELPSNEAEQGALWYWLLQLTDAAIDALHDDWSIDALEAELARIGPPPVCMNNTLASDATESRQAAISDGAPNSMKAFFDAYAATSGELLVNARCVWYSEVQFDFPIVMLSDRRDNSIAKLWQSASFEPSLLPWPNP